jgi:predicted esterase
MPVRGSGAVGTNRWSLLWGLVSLGVIAGGPAAAGEVRTSSGFVITGRPVPVEGLSAAAARQARGPVTIDHVWMVDDGMRRTFVPNRQVRDEDVSTENLLPTDELILQRTTTSRQIGPSIIGSYLEKTPFDEHGRRRVTLAGTREPIHIFQEITRLRPDTITVNSTSHRWTHALSTHALDDAILLSLLNKATDSQSSQDRLRVVRFLIDAERYPLAQQELATLRVDFPELKERADNIEEQLHHLIARKALGEIEQRLRAGQYRFAYDYAQKFPVGRVSAEIQRGAEEIIQQYRTQDAKIQTADTLLAQLQAELPPETAEEVAPLRSIVRDELSFATVHRLDPFLRTEWDESLTGAEKLALAYTGWLMGDTHAATNLPLAVRLWRARFLILEYLRIDREVDREALLSELSSLDGVSVERVAAMIPLLPLPVESGALVPRQPATFDVPATDDSAPIRYSVVLPPEYTPGQAYPLLVVLRSYGLTCEQMLQWWAGTPDQPGMAMHRGYIVAAPEYVDASTDHYDYGAAAHRAVLETIRDVRQRFQVDSDRIFLTGHGMGGDAAFDIGMSHPDQFAGVLTIVGICDRHCKDYWQNCPDLAWYVVGGERDRNSLEVNAKTLNRVMISGYDLTYTEYIERGYETYFEELPRMFDWMELHRRAPEPKEFEIEILRPTDAHIYWLEADGFREGALPSLAWRDGRRQTRPQPLAGTIHQGGTIYVKSGGQQTTVKLAPRLVDFSQRVRIHLGSRQVYNDLVAPDLQALLDELRATGDRQRLYWARLAF